MVGTEKLLLIIISRATFARVGSSAKSGSNPRLIKKGGIDKMIRTKKTRLGYLISKVSSF
jgi:hypothetical protein